MNKRVKVSLPIIGAIVASVSSQMISAAAVAPLYQWNFDQNGGTGTSVSPAVTPNGLATDGGTLTMANFGGFAFTPANLYTSGGGGVSGASTDYAFNNSASTSNNPNPGGITYSSGVADPNNANTVNALPNLTAYTLTMWIKPTTAELSAQSRIMEISTTTNFDEGSNGLWVALNAGKIQTGGGSAATNATLGNTLVANTWNFIAVEVDLATSNMYFDTAIRAASGNAVNDSLALYQGDATSGIYNYTGQAGAAAGTMNFAGTNSYLQLLNRSSNANRAFQGQGDDFQIFNSILTTAQLQTLAAEAPVPEPTGLLAVIAPTAAVLMRRKRCPQA